jgi:hypothetical protein
MEIKSGVALIILALMCMLSGIGAFFVAISMGVVNFVFA